MHLVDFGIPDRSGGNFRDFNVEAALQTSPRPPLPIALPHLHPARELCASKSPPLVNNLDFLDFLLSVTENPLFWIPTLLVNPAKSNWTFCQ